MATMKGKVCIVTGAASGIGLATAAALLDAGASVLGVDVASSPSQLDSVNFRFKQCNLTEASAPEEVVKACLDAFTGDRIDCLLNVAGVMDHMSSVDTLTDQEWDRVIAINLTVPVKLMRAVVPVMQKSGGGSIVNVSSKAGQSGAAAGVAYTSSKHGLIGATKNVAWRFKDDKIRCNAILPGGVITNIMKNSIDETKFDMKAYEKNKPAIDCQQTVDYLAPEQVASLIVYLASDASVGVSGSLVPIDSAWCTV